MFFAKGPPENEKNRRIKSLRGEARSLQLGGLDFSRFSVRNSLHCSFVMLIFEIGPLVRRACGSSVRVCDRLDYCVPTHASRHHLLVQIRDRLFSEDT